MTAHVDTDFLIRAVSSAGWERRRLLELVEEGSVVEISAVAWYEFSRGPRAPEQLAVARAFFGEDGVVPFSEELAYRAAETFRQAGSPRRRAADIAIGVTAVSRGAGLLSLNGRDFTGIPELVLEPIGP